MQLAQNIDIGGGDDHAADFGVNFCGVGHCNVVQIGNDLAVNAFECLNCGAQGCGIACTIPLIAVLAAILGVAALGLGGLNYANLLEIMGNHGDVFLGNQNYVANGALNAVGLAHGGAGCGIAGDNLFGVAQSLALSPGLVDGAAYGAVLNVGLGCGAGCCSGSGLPVMGSAVFLFPGLVDDAALGALLSVNGEGAVGALNSGLNLPVVLGSFALGVGSRFYAANGADVLNGGSSRAGGSGNNLGLILVAQCRALSEGSAYAANSALLFILCSIDAVCGGNFLGFILVAQSGAMSESRGGQLIIQQLQNVYVYCQYISRIS